MLRWMRSRRELLAELVETREQAVLQDLKRKVAVEQCGRANDLLEQAKRDLDQVTAQLHLAEADIARLTKQRSHLGRELNDSRRTLMRERQERAAVWTGMAPTGAGAVSRGELLREKARADQLAGIVERLQEANMRADCMHDIPTQEGAVAG